MVTTRIPLRNCEGKVIGLVGFSRHVDRVSGRAGTVDDFAKTVDYLKKKYNERLSTAGLAEMAGMSISQFERRFRRALNSSPRQYLLRLRVDAASRLLTFTNRPIARISEECGFHDHAHFTRSFKKMMNMTPLTFRKRQRENNPRSFCSSQSLRKDDLGGQPIFESFLEMNNPWCF